MAELSHAIQDKWRDNMGDMGAGNMEKRVQRDVSPDGLLAFLVIRDAGDISLGFEGYPWHTHCDIFGALSGRPIEEAVAGFVDDLMQNALIIAVTSVGGVVRDVWIKDDPEAPDSYQPENEHVHLRYCSGAPFQPGAPNRRWNL